MASSCSLPFTGGKKLRRRHTKSHKKHRKSHKKHAKSHKKHRKSHKKHRKSHKKHRTRRRRRRRSLKGGNMLMKALVPFGLWGAKSVLSKRRRHKKSKSHKK